MFDGDKARRRVAESVLQYLDTTKALITCVILPEALDPADYIAAYGISELQARIQEAHQLLDFVFTTRLAHADLSTPGRRIAVLDKLTALLSPLKHPALLDEYALRLGDAIGVDFQEARRRICATRPQKSPSRLQ